MAKATRWRACSLGVGRSFKRAQMATGTSGARYSSAAAMVAATGLGVSCEQGRRGGFYSRSQVGGEFPCKPRQSRAVGSQHGRSTAEERRRARGAGQVRRHDRWWGGGKDGLPGLWMRDAWRRGFGCGHRCGAVGPAVTARYQRSCPVGWRCGRRGPARDVVGGRGLARFKFKVALFDC
jgi:hypothetical protein